VVAPAGRRIAPWPDVVLVMPILAREERAVFGERAERSGHLVHTVGRGDDPRTGVDRQRREETDGEYEQKYEERPSGSRRSVAHASLRCSPYDVLLSRAHGLIERYF